MIPKDQQPYGFYSIIQTLHREDIPIWAVAEITHCLDAFGNETVDGVDFLKGYKQNTVLRAKVAANSRELVNFVLDRNVAHLFKAVYPDGDMEPASRDELPQEDIYFTDKPENGSVGYYLSVSGEALAAYNSGKL